MRPRPFYACRRSALWMTPTVASAQLGHGEWRTFCACGGWTTGLPWTIDWERLA